MYKKRIAYLDFIRVAAISGVVLGHVSICSSLLNNDPFITTLTISFLSILDDAMPLIFMISGVLMLDKNKELPIKKLITKYIIRIILAIIVFVPLFNLIDIVKDYLTNNNFNTSIFYLLLSSETYKSIFVNVITANVYGCCEHLWFLYAILFIYLLIPVLRFYVKKTSKNTQLLVLVFGAFIFVFGVNYISYFYPEINLGIITYFQYIVYYLCGYYLHNYVKASKNTLRIAIIIYVVFTFINFIELFYLYLVLNEFKDIWIISTFFIHSVAGYLIISQLKYKFPLCSKMNKYMFGIYIIHFIFMYTRLINFSSIPFIGIFVSFFLIYISSFCLVWTAKQIPIIKTYLF